MLACSVHATQKQRSPVGTRWVLSGLPGVMGLPWESRGSGSPGAFGQMEGASRAREGLLK